MNSNAPIKTRFLILSDTHNINLPSDSTTNHRADVAIHCGDLTQTSMLDEMQASIALLQQIDAPLKLVIAGNHDFTLDTPFFRDLLEKDYARLDPTAIAKFYGEYGEARQLFAAPDAQASGIRLLDEGTHQFTLQNGAVLTVYASPYTPARGKMGFQYERSEGHAFDIPPGVDVAMTHGPPAGVLDYTAHGQRAGCPDLLAAAARARPPMHCFGHIHEGWGARLVTWREKVGEDPSHSVLIDDDRSVLIEDLSTLNQGAEEKGKMGEQSGGLSRTSHCADNEHPLKPGLQTLFVNAAIEGLGEIRVQPPWLVDLELLRVA
ncbi:Metallo-dependent phosphatase [Aspergillus homomorphus CBS 101889]|uniref:Metallo-dependent phosphatase n=1 Tax=Aspergillus homomorphus (strain CBS 101889) TaxID=1450537 RepID=A0A395HWW5_ASPHC|nr:Metallo-dependent phosphatase [Aspergillus homomorphus CBS 101889]RAL10734.1 Metallo-dependent phosphatase [Aspergillus homomorphus CBS 101889]